MRRLAQLALVLAAAVRTAAADDVILPPDDFIAQTFGGSPPEPQTLWIDNATQAQLTPIFGHPVRQARIRYWREQGRTAWVLEEIGKEFPITAGFVVKDAQIDAARVLVYRESRGGEVRLPGFLKQFVGAKLQNDRLTHDIDGISGSTLSVWAMEKMARAALKLDSLAQ